MKGPTMAKRYHDDPNHREAKKMRGAHIQHSRPHGKENENVHRSGGHPKDSGALGPEYYSGAAARYAMERKDGGMIHENHNAIANLPQEVMIKPWPPRPGYLPEVLDDGISGIDRQLAMDDAYTSAGFEPKKI
jgi:hypothetical protein